MRSIVSRDLCTAEEDREVRETAAHREVRETVVRREARETAAHRATETGVRARETADRRGEDPCSSRGR